MGWQVHAKKKNGDVNMLNNVENNNEMVDFEEPLDMTNPNRTAQNSSTYNPLYDRRRMYDEPQAIKKVKTPIIQRITSLFVILAMIVAVAFLGYMATKGNFDIDKELALFKSVGILVYCIFLIDSIVVYGVNKNTSVILFALLLPVFYPIKRAYVTSDTKTVPLIWVVIFGVLGIFIYSNIHVQVERKIELIKTSSDEYSSECDEAMKMFKGQEIGERTLYEIVKANFDDVTWEAQKTSGNAYKATVKGNCDFVIDRITAPDALYNNNTKLEFVVDTSAKTVTLVAGTINGNILQPAEASTVWNYMCNNKE